MSGITDIDITYSAVIPPRTFKRIGGTALNASEGSNSSWLWLSKQTAKADIVDICVLHDDEAAPEGWEKLEKDASKGQVEGHSVFLAVRRGSHGADEDEQQPIVDIAVHADSGSTPGKTRTKHIAYTMPIRSIAFLYDIIWFIRVIAVVACSCRARSRDRIGSD